MKGRVTDMEKDLSYAYAEILEVLEYMDKGLVSRIPEEIIDLFRGKADPLYKRHLTYSLPLEEQNLSEDTLGLLAYLYQEYFCETEEQKEQLDTILSENEQKLKKQEEAEAAAARLKERKLHLDDVCRLRGAFTPLVLNVENVNRITFLCGTEGVSIDAENFELIPERVLSWRREIRYMLGQLDAAQEMTPDRDLDGNMLIRCRYYSSGSWTGHENPSVMVNRLCKLAFSCFLVGHRFDEEGKLHAVMAVPLTKTIPPVLPSFPEWFKTADEWKVPGYEEWWQKNAINPETATDEEFRSWLDKWSTPEKPAFAPIEVTDAPALFKMSEVYRNYQGTADKWKAMAVKLGIAERKLRMRKAQKDLLAVKTEQLRPEWGNYTLVLPETGKELSDPAVKAAMEAFRTHRYDEAVRLLEAVSNLYVPEAMTALGYLYENGLGTQKTDLWAKKMYAEAAERGQQQGLEGLSRLFMKSVASDWFVVDILRRFHRRLPPDEALDRKLALFSDPEDLMFDMKEAEKVKSPSSKLKWENVYIFISSTFNDMHAERDMMVKKCIPELRARCAEKKLKLIEIDLRWGISEEDAVNNKKVLDICLSNVDKCRPFFVCFLGQRTGWVPTKQDINEQTLKQFPGLVRYLGKKSITELEIIYALLDPMRDGHFSPADAFFYFRDPSYLEDISNPKVRALFDGTESERCDLETFKKQLACSYKTTDYKGCWDDSAISAELKNLRGENLSQGRLKDMRCGEDLLQKVIVEDLLDGIMRRFPEHYEVGDELTPLEKELEAQENHLFRLSDGYISRPEQEKKVLDRLLCGGHPCILEAPAGTGKSSLIARIISLCGDNYRILYRFIGTTAGTASLEETMQSLFDEMTAKGLLDCETRSAYIGQGCMRFEEALRSLTPKEPLLICLDGLDQSMDHDESPYWGPADLPEKVSLLVSYKTEAKEFGNCFQASGMEVTRLDPIHSETEKRSLIDGYLSQYLKTISERQVLRILDMEGSENPLYLKIVLEELRIFGSFDDLDEKLGNDYGVTTVSAFCQVIKRMRSECPEGAEEEILLSYLSALALSRNAVDLTFLVPALAQTMSKENVSEEEIHDQVMEITRQLYPYLTITGNTVSYLYDSFRQAVLSLQLKPAEQTHRLLFYTNRLMYEMARKTEKSADSAVFYNIYYHGGNSVSAYKEIFDIYRDPQLFLTAAEKIGCTCLSELICLAAEKLCLKDLFELAATLLSAEEVVQYDINGIFTEIRNSTGKDNRVVQEMLSRQEKELPLLSLRENSISKSLLRPFRSLKYLEFPKAEHVHRTVSVPYLIYYVEYGEENVSIYVQHIFTGKIEKMRHFFDFVSLPAADEGHLYLRIGYKRTILSVPELNTLWEGEDNLSVEGFRTPIGGSVGCKGKIYVRRIRLWFDESPYGVLMESRLYQLNGGTDGHTPVLSASMVRPDSWRPAERLQERSIEIFLTGNVIFLMDPELKRIQLLDIETSELLYENTSAHECRLLACKEQELFLLLKLGDRDHYYQQIIRLVREKENGNYVQKNVLNLTEAGFRADYGFAAGKCLIVYPWAKTEYLVLDHELNVLGKGKSSEIFNDDWMAPSTWEDYAFVMGDHHLKIYRGEDFLLQTTEKESCVTGSYDSSFTLDGKLYIANKKSLEISCMDPETGKVQPFARECFFHFENDAIVEKGKARYIWGTRTFNSDAMMVHMYCAYREGENTPFDKNNVIMNKKTPMLTFTWTPDGFYYCCRKESLLDDEEEENFCLYVKRFGATDSVPVQEFMLHKDIGTKLLLTQIDGKAFLTVCGLIRDSGSRETVVLEAETGRICLSVPENGNMINTVYKSIPNHPEDVFISGMDERKEMGRNCFGSLHINLRSMQATDLGEALEFYGSVSKGKNVYYIPYRSRKKNLILLYDAKKKQITSSFPLPFPLREVSQCNVLIEKDKYLVVSSQKLISLYDRGMNRQLLVRIFDEDLALEMIESEHNIFCLKEDEMVKLEIVEP